MKYKILLTLCLFVLLLATSGFMQDQNVKHFAKDGLSFDYPAGWSIDETKSTGQMQYVTLGRDGYAMIMVRSPRALIDTPEKEAHAKQLVQTGFLDAWAKNFSDSGATPQKSTVTIDVAGAPAECNRLSASLSGEPGRVDICWRLMEKRMVQLTIAGSAKDITKTTVAWDVIRNSVKIEPSTQQKPSASPSAKPF